MEITVIATVHRCEPVPDEPDTYNIEFMWVIPGVTPAGGYSDTVMTLEVDTGSPLAATARYRVRATIGRIAQTPIPFDIHMLGALVSAEPVAD